jgi:uncharacterized membrane protein YhaH (DUF805 family)
MMPGFLESDGRLGRGLFAFRFFITIVVWAALVLGVLHYVGWEWPREYQLAEFKADMGKTPEPAKPGAPAKVVPSYELAGFDRSALGAVSIFLSIVISVYGLGTMLVQVINRLRDLGWPGWYCLAMLPPLLDVVLLQGGYDPQGIWLKILVLPTVMMLGALLFLPGRGRLREEAHGHAH